MPPDAATSVEQYLLPHLADRERLYLVPLPFCRPPSSSRPDPVLPRTWYQPDAVDVVVAPTGYEAFAEAAGFAVVGHVPGYVILERTPGDGAEP